MYIGVLSNDKPEALPILEWDFSKIPKGTPRIASSEAKWDEESAYKDAPEVFPVDIPEPVYATPYLDKKSELAMAARKHGLNYPQPH